MSKLNKKWGVRDGFANISVFKNQNLIQGGDAREGGGEGGGAQNFT